MKKTDDAPVIARRISEFLCDYAPRFLTSSEHTLKGYKDSLVLYFQFLEESSISPEDLSRFHLEKDWIEKWIIWLDEIRSIKLDDIHLEAAKSSDLLSLDEPKSFLVR